MGCTVSKNGGPTYPYGPRRRRKRRRALVPEPEPPARPLPVNAPHQRSSAVAAAARLLEKKHEAEAAASWSFRLRRLRNSLEGEQAAAGWPSWLTSVAAEAIQGWIPLRADSFEMLAKVGQGSFSSVFRARHRDTGKMFALKKVRFDYFVRESVTFMAREIKILRRLDHPNVMKLEGVITSRSSRTLYLVFEYMEHDLAGLSSSPYIRFSEAQVKCYMKQLLSGLAHCHSRGILHRDIKGANVLVNNEGVLKIADFGLANKFDPTGHIPLTSHVVTLWYRPPEILLGSTHYDSAVDLWSAGCVFAELLRGRPILQGRTEVEQLHMIYKLCGSPADDFWRKLRLPIATVYRPYYHYLSTLRDVFRGLPEHALSLLETLLSVEPYNRGTASYALASEYFKTKPYACEPLSFPQYAPNKEIDAKLREETHRRKVSRGHVPEASKKSSRLSRAAREQSAVNEQSDETEVSKTKANVTKEGVRDDRTKLNGDARLFADKQQVSTAQNKERARHVKNDSLEQIPFSAPLVVSSSSGFAWAKKPDGHSFSRSRHRSSSRGEFTAELDRHNKPEPNENVGLKEQPNRDEQIARVNSSVRELHEGAKCAVLKKWSQLEHPDSFDTSNAYHSQKFSNAIYLGDALSYKNSRKDDHEHGERVEYSGPILSQSHKFDELLEKRECHIRQVVRKSWFGRGRK
uniref:Uncharacterized protein n=1 Tax=Avena sativa TaxID=4498 RepID=A0ACD5UK20_AVESA